MGLHKRINTIPPEIHSLIQHRLREFASFKDKPNEDWFSELCFCLLTANAKQKTGAAIQRDLGYHGFTNLLLPELVQEIKNHKHRFHNTKAERIILARNHKNIKAVIQGIVLGQGQSAAREWLVENVKGLGFKEASHFLRNTGHEDLAILDRHILRIMNEEGIIPSIPTLTKKNYLELEQKLQYLASSLSVSLSHLDLLLWYLQTGEVLK